jgi:transcription antitermination factor NusG
MSWYVLYTSPRAEKRVAARLRNDGVEVFLPIHKKRRKWSDRMKIVEVPLFNSYVFVRCSEQNLYSLLMIYGIKKIVYYLHRPAIVRECEIEAIKEFLKIAENKDIIYAGDQVEIVSGPFHQKCCKVLKVEKDRLILFLEELGAKIYVSLSEVDKLKSEGVKSKSEYVKSKSEGAKSKSEGVKSKSKGVKSKSEGVKSKSKGGELKPELESEKLQSEVGVLKTGS